MTTDKPWAGIHNVKKIALMNHPERGVLLLAMDQLGSVRANSQTAPGSPLWSGWGDVIGQDASGYRLAGAQHALGMSQAWMLAMDGTLKGAVLERGGGWQGEGGPSFQSIASYTWNVVGDPKKPIFANAQRVLGRQTIWGVTRDGKVVTGNVTPMTNEGLNRIDTTESFNNAPRATGIAATMRNEGTGQVWILDTYRRLWSSQFIGAEQSWSPWTGPAQDQHDGFNLDHIDLPGWNGAPKLLDIAVSQHRGAIAGAKSDSAAEQPDHILLGVTTDYQLIVSVLRNGQWGPWSPSWPTRPGLKPKYDSDSNPTVCTLRDRNIPQNDLSWNNLPYPDVQQAAAVQQNNGCLQVWAVSLQGFLLTASQTKPGGDWGPWHM